MCGCRFRRRAADRRPGRDARHGSRAIAMKNLKKTAPYQVSIGCHARAQALAAVISTWSRVQPSAAFSRLGRVPSGKSSRRRRCVPLGGNRQRAPLPQLDPPMRLERRGRRSSTTSVDAARRSGAGPDRRTASFPPTMARRTRDRSRVGSNPPPVASRRVRYRPRLRPHEQRSHRADERQASCSRRAIPGPSHGRERTETVAGTSLHRFDITRCAASTQTVLLPHHPRRRWKRSSRTPKFNFFINVVRGFPCRTRDGHTCNRELHEEAL